MAGKKISELQALTTLTGDEELPVAISGDNRKVTSSLLVEGIKTAQSGLLARVNDDMSGLLGKLAVRDGVGEDIKNLIDGKYFNIDGVLTGSTAFKYQFIDVDPNSVYLFKTLTIISYVGALCLFDKDGNVIKVSKNDGRRDEDKYFFFVGVAKIGISISASQANDCKIFKFNIQDLTTVLNTQQGNRALYVAAGAVYNEKTGFYELNGLTDITEEEMRTIYLQTHHVTRQTDLSGVFASANNIRTNYPFKIDGGYKQVLCHATFAGCTNIEVVAFTKSINNVFYSTRVNYLFQHCRKLKEVIGIIRMDYADPSEKYKNMFYQCTSLVRVSLRGVKYDISFSDSPLISLESLQFMITSAANTSPIIVTVHADVYAKIQDETNAEWHALIEMAAAKQITFATA